METRADVLPPSLSLPASHGWCQLPLREQGSPMKNRKREICTSGSVRDEDGKPPHRLGRRKFLHLAAGAAALPALSQIAWAQAYPSRPITIIVPFPAGGATTTLARVLAEHMKTTLGQPIVVENAGGASGSIRTTRGARPPPRRYPLRLRHL